MGKARKEQRQAQQQALGQRAWHEQSYPAILIFFLALYCAIFVLDLLDVNVDDGSGLIREYEKVRNKNLELERLELERLRAARKEKLDTAVQKYQGDEEAPWENPFSQDKLGKAKPMNKETETAQLHDELEQAIFAYLRANAGSIESSEQLDTLVHEKDVVREKLRKRQVLVEERFDKVVEMEGSMRPRDYAYQSVFSNPELRDKLTVPTVALDSPSDSFLSSILSSFNIFGGSSKNGQAGGRGGSASGDELAQEREELRGDNAFAALANPDKAQGKASSVGAIERALIGLGYGRHKSGGTRGPGLPLWLIAYGRKCPPNKLVVAKDAEPRAHAVMCAAYSTAQQLMRPRQLLLATDLESLSQETIDAASEGEFRGAVEALVERLGAEQLPAHAFFRFSAEVDRKALAEISAPGFAVVQKGGAGKLQAVKAVKGLLTNEKYQDEGLGIVGGPLSNDQRRWTGGRAMVLRAWIVLLRGEPVLAYGADPDVLVSKTVFVPFPPAGKESPEATLAMRFPSLAVSLFAGADDVDVEPLEGLPAALGISAADVEAKILEPLRRMTAFMALAQAAGAPPRAKSSSGEVHAMQHICLDFTVEADLSPKLLAHSPACPLDVASPGTQEALLAGAVQVAEHLLLKGEAQPSPPAGLRLLVDEAQSFVLL